MRDGGAVWEEGEQEDWYGQGASRLEAPPKTLSEPSRNQAVKFRLALPGRGGSGLRQHIWTDSGMPDGEGSKLAESDPSLSWFTKQQEGAVVHDSFSPRGNAELVKKDKNPDSATSLEG